MTDQTQPTLEQDQPQAHEQSFIERHNIHPIVFAIACLGIVFFLYQVIAGTITVIAMGEAKITRDNVFITRLLTMVGQLLFIFLPTVWFARLLSVRMASVFQWRVPSVRETIFGLLGLVWLQQIFQIYLFFQERIPLPDVVKKLLDPIKQMMEEMFRGLIGVESLPELAFVLLVVAFVPAVVEELLFRGVIQNTFERMVKPLWAAVITGAIFGLFHFNPFAVLPLIGLGCYFGILKMRSQSIILPMTAHFVNNALAVIVAYFGMDDEAIVGMGTEAEPTTSVVLIQLVMFVMFFALSFLAYLRATAESPEKGEQE
ncbi:MAG: CPBP family intramembrane metalloprotease [Ignavibacteriae bacterium]|nr:CPBP family intramembrane metalloprotease [Ignavibacteriota bacterium]